MILGQRSEPSLCNQLEETFDDLSYGHHSSCQREGRNETREHESNKVEWFHGQNLHFSDDVEAIAEIGQGLNVARPEQRLFSRPGLLNPSSVKGLRIFTPERAILHQAAPF